MSSSKVGNGIKTFYAALYMVTSCVNLYLALACPWIVKGLGSSALFPWLRTIINSSPSWLYVGALLLFASAQTFFWILLLHRGYWAKAGAIGGIAFHLSVVPFAPTLWVNILIALPLIYLVFWLEVMDLDNSAWDALVKKARRRII